MKLICINRFVNRNKMNALKYTVIKNREQYNRYTNMLEQILEQSNRNVDDEIELLTLLIEKYDDEQDTLVDSDPIELLKLLMSEHGLKAKDIAEILDLSKGTVSKILNYQKGLSKETIRKLAMKFKVSQETFNRPYRLKTSVSHKAIKRKLV